MLEPDTNCARGNVGYVPTSYFLEFLFNLVLWPFRLRKRDVAPASLVTRPHFIIFRVGAIGDYIISAPFVDVLRRYYPSSTITVLGTKALGPLTSLYQAPDQLIASDIVGLKKISKLISFSTISQLKLIAAQLKKADERIFICLNRQETIMGTLKCMLFQLLCRPLLSFGFNTRGRGDFLTYSVADNGYLEKHEVDYFNAISQQILAHVPIREEVSLPVATMRRVSTAAGADIKVTTLVVHPGGGSDPSIEKWANKRWPVTCYVELINQLSVGRELVVILTGSKDELHLASAIEEKVVAKVTNLAAKTNFEELQNILAGADLFLGSDSGVSHLASYLDVPSVVLYFYTDYIGFSPIGKHTVVVRPEIACSPCLYWFDRRPCKGTDWSYKCRDVITVERVRAELHRFFPSP